MGGGGGRPCPVSFRRRRLASCALSVLSRSAPPSPTLPPQGVKGARYVTFVVVKRAGFAVARYRDGAKCHDSKSVAPEIAALVQSRIQACMDEYC